MFTKTTIYTAYEKPEAHEPTDRVELVREGFSFFAFAFTVFWLAAHRLWLAAFLYMALLAGLMASAEMLQVPTLTVGVAQLVLQLLLGYSAFDLRRAKLAQHGYRFAGVIVADSDLAAEQRYFAHAA